jgi:adenosylhomocysteine nucleosidase
MTERVIGIMSAMLEEILGVEELLEDREQEELGMRTYYTGKINGIKTVVVFSRWGKVAAATTVATLIQKFNITELIFTGVAGGISPDLNIGDIVIGTRFIQHDMDARPIIAQYELPLHNIVYLESSAERNQIATNAVNYLLDNKHLHEVISQEDLDKFGIHAPKLLSGTIASGDKFFSVNEDKERLLENIPSVLCVEMEGAAVAQVCYEYNIPYTILRTISDTADEKSAIDFPSFIEHVSSKYSVEIVKNMFRQISHID